MKVTIKGFVIATQYPWNDEPQIGFACYDSSKYNDTDAVVCEHQFDVEIPDGFDMRPHLVSGLEKQKEKARLEFAMKVKELDDRINSLLAIGTAKVVDDGTTD